MTETSPFARVGLALHCLWHGDCVVYTIHLPLACGLLDSSLYKVHEPQTRQREGPIEQ